MIYTVWDATETYTCVIINDTTYDVLYDEYTGDWLVSCDEDDMVQNDWMLDKESAVQYALMRAGVIDEASYDMAPDRTSA